MLEPGSEKNQNLKQRIKLQMDLIVAQERRVRSNRQAESGSLVGMPTPAERFPQSFENLFTFRGDSSTNDQVTGSQQVLAISDCHFRRQFSSPKQNAIEPLFSYDTKFYRDKLIV